MKPHEPSRKPHEMSFQKLVQEIGVEINRMAESQRWDNTVNLIEASNARSHRRNELMAKSLADAEVLQRAQSNEQALRDRALHRQRMVEKFEEAKESFAKAIASGELFGVDIIKTEIELQRIGEAVSRL